MSGHLYFVCPTDHLEPLINKKFKGQNYFISTLGNSLVFDAETVLGITDLLDRTAVKEITFILTNNNNIIVDGIENKQFSDLDGIKDFYHSLEVKKQSSEMLYKTHNHSQLIISYHLNEKIKELQTQLSIYASNQFYIQGMMYNRMDKTFSTIHHDLIFRDLVSLN